MPTDFVTPGGIRLNRSAVPLGLDSASHSNPQSSPPLLPTLSNPQPSAVSPQNSNLPVLPPLPLTSELSPEENNLQVLPPKRTYSRLPSSSTHVVTPLPIHIDGPSTSSPISVPNRTQAAANLFSVEDTSLSLSLDSSTASDGEFGCLSDQNSSSKPRARRSLNTFHPRGVYILRGVCILRGRSIYTPRPLKPPVRAEYIYYAIFIRLLKKKYWGYWLQVCTIRPLHVCRFSGSVRIRSRPVEAYASLSGENGGATSCYVIRLNACLCFMPADSRLQMH